MFYDGFRNPNGSISLRVREHQSNMCCVPRCMSLIFDYFYRQPACFIVHGPICARRDFIDGMCRNSRCVAQVVGVGGAGYDV